MAKKKISEEVTVAKDKVSFSFFKNEVEEEGMRAMTAAEMTDPSPNKSGSYNLDYDLTIPFPAGRITEVFGEEGSCKTTLILEVLARAILNGKIALYVNAEKNLNLSLLRTIRSLKPYIEQAITNMANGTYDNDCPLWIINSSNGEQALESMRKFASMVPDGVAALDSIDAAQPEAVLAGEIGDTKVGNLAKLMSDAMRKLITVSEENRVALIFINQIRDKITMYGDPTDTPGGRAVKFYASQRIKLMKPGKSQTIVNGDGDRIGVNIRYKIVKNKVAPDGNEGEFPILFNNGIFREQELITKCCNFGILRMGGKGGQQVFLPKIDPSTNEFAVKDGVKDETCISQFNAARRLLLDPALFNKLDNILQATIDSWVDQVVEESIEE